MRRVKRCGRKFSSQKLQILSNDLESGFKALNFKVPLFNNAESIKQNGVFGVWSEEVGSNGCGLGHRGLMILEVVRKWEYGGGGSNNTDNWATISEFELKLDNEIVKDSSNQEIKGYIVEPAETNPNPKRIGHNLPPEQQQKNIRE